MPITVAGLRAFRMKDPQMEAPKPGHKYQKIDIVRTQQHAVWLRHMRKPAIYQECKNCKTKIEEASRECKRHAEKGCETDPGDMRALTTVTIADASGSCDNISLQDEMLLVFTKCNDIAELQTKVEQGVSLDMVLRADIRLGASNAAVDGDDVNFGIIQVEPFLLRDFRTPPEDRPNPTNATRLANEIDEGAIVSIAKPSDVTGEPPLQLFAKSIPCSKVPRPAAVVASSAFVSPSANVLSGLTSSGCQHRISSICLHY